MPRAKSPTKWNAQLARVAFTGKLASMTRADARALVRDAGGQAVPGVSRRTSMLVIGMDGWPLLRDGTLSNKLQRAEELNRQGANVRIISEDEFLEAAGKRERKPALRKAYDAARICEIAGLAREQLLRWEIAGLIRAENGLYDFQDLVSLSAIAELVKGGAQPEQIRRSIRSLSRVLPATERPLAQLKLVMAKNGTLLAEVEGALIAPDGQAHLRFDDRPQSEQRGADEAIPIQSSLKGVGLSAAGGGPPDASIETLFDHATELEEAEQFEQAEETYRTLLAAQPYFPEAHFNLANTLAALGRLQAAEERYRVALEQDSSLAEAWYNLADVMERSGRVREAIDCLHRALKANPTYADAHFNLGSWYDRLGQSANAAHHWRAYLQLDPHSEWADAARRALE